MARVRMNKLDAPAYKQAFHAVFSQVKVAHPEFAVGDTLKGIIADWSDTQLKGLQSAVGEENANKVVKGCQVSQRIGLYIMFYCYFLYVRIGALPTLCKKSQRKS